MPGVRLNVSKSGTSFSLGKPGATLNVGGKRPRATVGIPGTGISFTQNLTETRKASSESPDQGAFGPIVGLVKLALALYGIYLVVSVLAKF